MVNATLVRPQCRGKVTKVYDLSQFPQPVIGEVREAAGMLRVLGISVDRQFACCSEEVSLDAVEAKAAEIEETAARLRALIGRAKRA